LKFQFDREDSSLYIKFNDNKILESEELENGVVVDFDENENIVGFEILDLQKYEDFEFPFSIDDLKKEKFILKRIER
jgi:uncharacterized protein YuzE